MTLFRHDGAETEALVTDRYLESLLLAGERRADDTPSDAALPPALRRAARQLSIDLVRVHPSFRFEERLAARLAEAAAGMRLAETAAGAGEAVIPPSSAATPRSLPAVPPAASSAASAAPAAPPVPAAAAQPGPAAGPAVPLSRPLIVGGALTSAALWLAGAAYLAWRRNRSPLGPMARAARAAHAVRAAQLVQAGQAGLAGLAASSAAGLTGPVATPATPAGSPVPD